MDESAKKQIKQIKINSRDNEEREREQKEKITKQKYTHETAGKYEARDPLKCRFYHDFKVFQIKIKNKQQSLFSAKTKQKKDFLKEPKPSSDYRAVTILVAPLLLFVVGVQKYFHYHHQPFGVYKFIPFQFSLRDKKEIKEG